MDTAEIRRRLDAIRSTIQAKGFQQVSVSFTFVAGLHPLCLYVMWRTWDWSHVEFTGDDPADVLFRSEDWASIQDMQAAASK